MPRPVLYPVFLQFDSADLPAKSECILKDLPPRAAVRRVAISGASLDVHAGFLLTGVIMVFSGDLVGVKSLI